MLSRDSEDNPVQYNVENVLNVGEDRILMGVEDENSGIQAGFNPHLSKLFCISYDFFLISSLGT